MVTIEERRKIGQRKPKEPKKFQIGGTEVTKEEFLNARSQLGFEQGRTGTPPLLERKFTPRAESAIEELKTTTQQKEGQKFLEEKGFFEETLPQEVSLAGPERTGVETLPVIGPGISALRQIEGPISKVARAVGESLFGIKVKKETFGLKDREALGTLIQNPQTAREVALQQIQKNVLKEGSSNSERFGAFIEAIPIIGAPAAKYSNGLIEDPAGNVDTMVKELKDIRGRALKLSEDAQTAAINPFLAFEQLEDMEENSIALEQRIKILSLESASLIADADTLNLIQDKILRTKESIFIAKQDAARGIQNSASNERIIIRAKEDEE